MTRDEALTILESGEFDRFVGVEEDREVEFKGSPYQLNTDAAKFELAKDVSALANASGGVIILGVRTARHPEVLVDVVEAIRPLDRGLLNEERYLDVIGDRIYPRVDGVRVRFFEGDGGDGRGLALIDVPAQRQAQKFFLVHRPIGGEERTPGWLVGIAIRSGGRVDEQRIGEVHGLINLGLNVSRQLSHVAARVEKLHEGREPVAALPEDDPSDRIPSLVATRLGELGPPMTTDPLLVLAAAPKQATDVQTFTQAQGVREVLEQPPQSRHAGFNLRTFDRAALVGGTRLSVSGGSRLHIDLLEDGTLLVFAAFNELLGWRDDFFEHPKVHGLAVVEFVHDFVLLYAQIAAEYLAPKPTLVRFSISLHKAVFFDEGGNQKRLYLSPGPLQDFVLPYGDKEAPGAGFDWFTDAGVADGDPTLEVGEVGYRLVRRFYNWFGHTDDAVPYTNDEATAIDIARVQAVR